MKVEEIGGWAGIVWNELSAGGPMTVKEIKKASKLREKDIYAAIGWLARENKVKFEDAEGEKDAIVSLV